jgi:hypothetical protein
MISKISRNLSTLLILQNALKAFIAAVFLPYSLLTGNFQIGFTIALGAIFAYPERYSVILSIKPMEFWLPFLCICC